jgi:ABC-type phosphate transport system substrate-binding protein
MGIKPSAQDSAKIKSYKADQAKIMKEATAAEAESKEHVAKHKVLARCITLFQIAIAIGAIAIIVKRKSLWVVSLSFAAVGIFFFVQGIIL